MENVYKYLKLFRNIRSRRVKLFGVLSMHLLGHRYIGIFLDPTLGCNFRCRMCYFSDEEKRKSMHGHLNKEEIDRIAQAFFHRALKLQIGCGAEPTLSKHLAYLIKRGKETGIPYISITTNGGLIDYRKLKEYLDAGLDEVTLSCHGVNKNTYEHFMPGGNHEHFTKLLGDIARLKKEYPALNVRINYTMNEDNVEELSELPNLLKEASVNVLQVRPIQELGKTDYHNFSIEHIHSIYEQTLEPLRAYCQAQGITCIMPTKEDLTKLHESPHPADQYIEDLLYCHISPHSWWHGDFNPQSDTFESYCKKHNWVWKMIKHILHPSLTPVHNEVTKRMNYTIK